jgi:ABC-type nickel/cobalt efflux system permease component RcnA
MTSAFSTDQAKAVAIVVILVVVVAGALLSFVVTKLVGRLIVAALVVGLGIFVWTQRADIESNAKKCNARLFGIHLSPSNQAIRQRCEQIASR